MKWPLNGRFMKKRNQLHHNLEAGKTEAIMSVITIRMGMSNYKKIMFRL